jgi:hypothetical protein
MQKVATMKIQMALVLLAGLILVRTGSAQTAKPTLADASPVITKMNGGRTVDCTAAKVKIQFGSGRGEGYCQAALADLIKAWENGLDLQTLDKITPAEQMPAPQASAYELKGDKLGASMAEYLSRHPADCVAQTAAAPIVHRSVFSGNVLTNTSQQHPSDIKFACTNYSLSRNEVTLATAPMKWEEVDFSHQRLYRVAYEFNEEHFGLVQAAFVLKFGPPTSADDANVQNGFGAHYTRTTLVWKNGVSTIVLSQMSGGDLTLSQVEITLDDVYSVVTQRDGGKAIIAVKKDM